MLKLQKPEYFIYRKLGKKEAVELGDGLLAALFVAILNDNKIKAYLAYQKYVLDLVDCPKIYGPLARKNKQGWNFIYRPECEYDGRSIVQKAIDLFVEQNGIKKEIQRTRNVVPVVFEEMLTEGVDVALNTQCGRMGKYREWPYFTELKRELKKNKISFIDLDEKKIRGNLALNYVKKSKLYVGLDTGMSHYVSSVVNDSLIIQTGYSTIDYWSVYNYDYIETPNVQCKNCCLKSFSRCPHNYFCMRNFLIGMFWKE